MALDWLKDLGGRPDHPMTDAAEAARLLAELPRDDPEAALPAERGECVRTIP